LRRRERIKRESRRRN